jgi:hypothetical protein
MTVDEIGNSTEYGVMTTQQASPLKTRWTQERVARLGFLVGQGWDAKRVARDPLIASTATNVHRVSRYRLGPLSPARGGWRPL